MAAANDGLRSGPALPPALKSRGEASGCGCGPAACAPSSKGINRRDFVQLVGAGMGLTAVGSGAVACAGPFDEKDTIDHFVPADKKLSAEWVRKLVERGERTWYTGNDLKTIGMPVGGVGAGQVYLSGDGRLVYWDIFNSNHNTGYGAINYKEGRQATDVVTDGRFTPSLDVAQGFAIQVKSGGRTVARALDAKGFQQVRFSGEYPLGFVEYEDSAVPVAVHLEAFSPFIPLDASDSALPVTVLNYTVSNTSGKPAEVSLAGWLQNAVLMQGSAPPSDAAVRQNDLLRAAGMTAIIGRAKPLPQKKDAVREPIVFADFETDGYGDWQVEGEAFGKAPVKGTLPGQQRVTGFRGERLINSFVGGDGKQGKLTSPTFKIDRPWIGFLIGGGQHAERACMHLVIDDKQVRTATGLNREQLEPHSWDVREFNGKSAHLEIVDAQSGSWGHINIDQIEFRDEPMGDQVPLRRRPDFGSMAIAVLGGEGVFARKDLSAGKGGKVDAVFDERAADDAKKEDSKDAVLKPLDQELTGAVGRRCSLQPGEQQTITFLVGWHLPNNYRENSWVGNYYAKGFKNAGEVVAYMATNFDRLAGDTRKWHRTYYDSTLPYWLLDRVGATVCNLATGTCQWWRNGRFWAWEGVGCCHGNCGHVWNYEHAMARLFPELERSVRTMQDFVPGIGFNAETGSIGFRGEGWTLWAGDAQGGYILKAYREHLCSVNGEFLNTNWPNIRKAVEFLFSQDKNDDGLIEGAQHQTYDVEFYGANTYVGSMYLGALRAAEVMANLVGDPAFARRCRKVFEAGRDNSVKRLFNGEYYIQTVDLKAHPDWQYADGCLADHMIGQGWAHQVGLGHLYPQETVISSLKSLWKYNWAPDIAQQNKHHDPQRWFAMPGEAGLFMCTWPKSKHLGPKSTQYRDEVWTGTEYQVANHMAWEGMLTECLAMCRAVHERYHPSKRNPFNEIECGDHYARALASWGVLISLAGFTYDGPGGHIGFAPRITPEKFKTVFTTAAGWGRFEQQIDGNRLIATLQPQWGNVRLSSLSLDLPAGKSLKSATLKLGDIVVAATPKPDGKTVTFKLPTDVEVDASQALNCELQLA